MGALILKSKNSLQSGVVGIELASFINRVESDGGEIVDIEAVGEAINFANKNNISASNDVGTASPRWAVKKENGKVVKLYSLLNPDADIFVYIRDLQGGVINSYGFNVLRTLGHPRSAVLGVDFEFRSNMLISSIAKPTPLPTGQDYSANKNVFTLANITRTGVEAGADKGLRLIDVYYQRDSLSDLPNKWYEKFEFSASSKYLERVERITPSVVNTDPALKNQSGFSTTVTYVENNRFFIARDGKKLFEYALPNTKPFEGTFRAHYTDRGILNGDYQFPAVTDIAEVWTLRDVSDTTAVAISKRSQELYSGI